MHGHTARFSTRAGLATAHVLLALATLSFSPAPPAVAQTPAPSAWRQPAAEILEVLHAPGPSSARLSPTGTTLALLTPLPYPPLADLAQPMLRLAGVRVLPASNGRHGEYHSTGLSLVATRDGTERRVALPADARVFNFRWSANGERFVFLNQTPAAIELWAGETRTATAKRVGDLRVNPVLHGETAWMPDPRHLLVRCVPAGRGPAPQRPASPPGPKLQETAGGTATSTYEARDLLTGPHDAELFAYYAQGQLMLVDLETGQARPVGAPGLITSADPSPDGRFLLVERLRPPFSYAQAWYRFARDVEVWDLQGKVVQEVAKLPLADRVPIHGVPDAPRDFSWRATAPATLVWIEALDGGDPGRAAEQRDLLRAREVPFDQPPRDLYRAPHRVTGWQWGADGLVVVYEWERSRRWVYRTALDADHPETPPRRLFDLSANDAYGDPGEFVMKVDPDGHAVLDQDGENLFLIGQGASPGGMRPFLDRYSLSTGETERLFRSDSTGVEWCFGWIDRAARMFLTRRESPADHPNFAVRTLTSPAATPAAAGEPEWTSTSRPITRWTDPIPQVRAIQKRIVTYARADGTPLSFTLYLPPGYVEGTRLPTVIDAYPLEYSDPSTAGQVTATDQQFTRLAGTSSLFFLLDGYAVLQDVTMPVIGHPDNAYDTFIEQLLSSTEAAIAKATELGVTDPDRVGIMGHSHGGLMTATLLAHSNLCRAGIARSGAYNHTIRPFGFQGERRTYWQAPENYVKLSPTLHADKIDEPLLIIHGEVDENPGTVPLQSEKLYEAIRGTGGRARLLILPHEGHGYRARESVEQVLAEQLDWFRAHVKEAPARTDR